MSTPSAARLVTFADPAALAAGAAREVTRIVRAAVADRGTCALVLAGGSTPRRLYEALAGEPYRSEIDWSKIQLFWGDERCVPADDCASNYAMARQALLSRIPIAERAVHRIAGELEPERAASLYEEELRRLVGGAVPRLDLVLLGLGADGHTASLFPSASNAPDEERLVIATLSPEPPRHRVTLTPRVLNFARTVMFLVHGEEKAGVVREVIAHDMGGPPSRLPAANVRPLDGTLLWFLDSAAASALGP